MTITLIGTPDHDPETHPCMPHLCQFCDGLGWTVLLRDPTNGSVTDVLPGNVDALRVWFRRDITVEGNLPCPHCDGTGMIQIHQCTLRCRSCAQALAQGADDNPPVCGQRRSDEVRVPPPRQSILDFRVADYVGSET